MTGEPGGKTPGNPLFGWATRGERRPRAKSEERTRKDSAGGRPELAGARAGKSQREKTEGRAQDENLGK